MAIDCPQPVVHTGSCAVVAILRASVPGLATADSQPFDGQSLGAQWKSYTGELPPEGI